MDHETRQKLQKELNVPGEILKDFIIEQNKQGKVVLTKGDPSLYSEEIRSAAVHIDYPIATQLIIQHSLNWDS